MTPPSHFLGLLILMKPGPDPELVSGCSGLIPMGDWCGSAYAYTAPSEKNNGCALDKVARELII